MASSIFPSSLNRFAFIMYVVAESGFDRDSGALDFTIVSCPNTINGRTVNNKINFFIVLSFEMKPKIRASPFFPFE
jgi:hypothetical protein